MEMTPEQSVAARHQKTNATPWKFGALSAARHALSLSGHDGATVTWRDGRVDDVLAWASFDVHETGEVVMVAQIERGAPAGSLVVDTAWGDMGVWRYPNDPALPGLPAAATPGGLRAELARVAPQVDADLVHMVALQPLQRAVVRVGDGDHCVYVKVLPPWRTATVAERHHRAHRGGLPAPVVLAVHEARGLIVFEALSGTPLAEHLETGRPVPSAEEMWVFVRRLAHVVGTHGDLHDRQLLVDDVGTITGVVDLDDAGEGDLIDDLARLLAHMLIRGDTHPNQRARVGDVVHELRAVLGEHVNVEALDRHTAGVRHRLEVASRTRDARVGPT